MRELQPSLRAERSNPASNDKLDQDQAGLLRRFAPRNDGVRYNGNDRECADPIVIASAAKQSSFERPSWIRTSWIASSLRSSQRSAVYGNDRECADPIVIASAAKQSSFERQAGSGQAGLLPRFAPRKAECSITGMTANARTQPSLRAERSNPASTTSWTRTSWIASSLRSSAMTACGKGGAEQKRPPWWAAFPFWRCGRQAQGRRRQRNSGVLVQVTAVHRPCGGPRDPSRSARCWKSSPSPCYRRSSGPARLRRRARR